MDRRKGFQYQIQYTKAADKFFFSHEEVRQQYEDAIRELLMGDHPESVNVKKIRGKRSEYYRIRIGGYRVVYSVINGIVVVICTQLAGSRGDVYKKMSGLK